ncbi:glutaredoxin [Aspergillus piperis CBS 112811]|uniref:Glutaredoxin n=1 Tax=Aspergillus piperis CBS 112811 TaxID=1448313 RepID=A0A8G1VPI5_9EURO|nr:glutaredoxin [Aspergillus piperis CBS 112811]RAH60816.1 glutaredoxin [Aspergillus piperis CBS 112811]
MLSQRRIRLLAIAVVVIIIMTFYYSSEARSVQNQQFYRSTVAAMEAQKQAKEAGTAANIPPQKDQPKQNPIKEETKPAMDNDREEPAIPKANNDADEVEEIPIAGRTKMTVPKNRNDPEKETSEQLQEQKPETDDHAAAVAELNGILKRAPIIVFSKSYCPYSAKAKSILLDKYSIVPAPFVVELDKHELGRPLQALLGENTGRRTVPNVLVNGKSIGGGDDVTALDQKDELASTLRSLGGKWVQEVHRKE